MNKTVREAVALASAIKPAVAGIMNVEFVVAPTTAVLSSVSAVIDGSNVALSAQNIHWEASGAFTGEISAGMAADIGCSYVIVAHSERRQFFGETNATANQKLVAAHGEGLTPIYCVGESLEQREIGITDEHIGIQIKEGLKGLSKEQMLGTVIAYEPIWAIGTGLSATPTQAQHVHAFIRLTLEELYDAATAREARVLYGGSVKPDNIESLVSQPDIDGALIGGASLQAESYTEMARIVSRL